ncbi:P-loop containing nucleoside triphosphate hydrolases superfamily protein isoform 1 [Hibiscus syriacus]|uniref:P-loop containing nucleoside triphosphate hydrolases superfamily protein isoform 1 n=1 Tax=Hibiscus syriacus TaxID=106335 RepID=A0A6A2WBN9_HIBSY|nr:P-loop containing nucleoside triphosphate hydrolases superfamily protein isoform 1 [Hibiscus syriacus]
MATMLKELPSLSTLLSAYASISVMAMLIRTILNDMVPERMRNYITSKLYDLTAAYFSSEFVFVIEDRWHAGDNQMFRAAEVYLPTIIGPTSDSILVGFDESSDPMEPPKRSIPVDCTITDDFDGMRLQWSLSSIETKKIYHPNKRFNLTCKKSDGERVEQRSFLRTSAGLGNVGYLLYGPPGTGKSSLVAAIANYMRYNVYDLQFQSVRSDSELRSILTSTTNRSTLLIEDRDCSTKVTHDRTKANENSDEEDEDELKRPMGIDPGVTLSGLLNFIDGLWSSCGHERIIIFTTNHKEKLDSALLRPGRMDVHIYMGYCSPAGFRKLASSYLGIKDDKLFGCIDDLIKSIEVTPAEVAQQLMINDEPRVALQGLIEFLNTKKKDIEEAATEEKEKSIKEEEET